MFRDFRDRLSWRCASCRSRRRRWWFYCCAAFRSCRPEGRGRERKRRGFAWNRRKRRGSGSCCTDRGWCRNCHRRWRRWHRWRRWRRKRTYRRCRCCWAAGTVDLLEDTASIMNSRVRLARLYQTVIEMFTSAGVVFEKGNVGCVVVGHFAQCGFGWCADVAADAHVTADHTAARQGHRLVDGGHQDGLGVCGFLLG